MVRAWLPLGAVNTVAALDDVRTIQSAAPGVTNVGALTSQGYMTHTDNRVVIGGITGVGVTVGVLSDSASPTCVSSLIATGICRRIRPCYPVRPGAAPMRAAP